MFFRITLRAETRTEQEMQEGYEEVAKAQLEWRWRIAFITLVAIVLLFVFWLDRAEGLHELIRPALLAFTFIGWIIICILAYRCPKCHSSYRQYSDKNKTRKERFVVCESCKTYFRETPSD
jgi:hypothetical protein